uniref:Uncharacterized protein n=1 Tax=Anguilla anguilla TaxID=7936 RepID=A0A0E9TGA4_ANGAN
MCKSERTNHCQSTDPNREKKSELQKQEKLFNTTNR